MTTLEEAREANEKLRSSMELRALVEIATEATQGDVYFVYSSQPKSTVLYLFAGNDKLMTVDEASEWLQQVTRDAQPNEETPSEGQ